MRTWNCHARRFAAGRLRPFTLMRDVAGGADRPHEGLVVEPTAAVGLPPRAADGLGARDAERLPWNDVPQVLTQLAAAGLLLGVITIRSRWVRRVAAGAPAATPPPEQGLA